MMGEILKGGTYTTIKQNIKSCTYVGLYGSSLFNFGSYVSLPTLFTCFLGFDIPTSSFIFIENVFYYSCIREYGSTLYVGMARKKNGRPYISIASDELKSLVIYTDKF